VKCLLKVADQIIGILEAKVEPKQTLAEPPGIGRCDGVRHDHEARDASARCGKSVAVICARTVCTATTHTANTVITRGFTSVLIPDTRPGHGCDHAAVPLLADEAGRRICYSRNEKRDFDKVRGGRAPNNPARPAG
jgi:hypothetical protein